MVNKAGDCFRVEDRPRLLFVSHLARRASGGGVFAVTWQIARLLDQWFSLDDPGPVVPCVNKLDAMWSKIRRRMLRMPGSSYQFSPRTLHSTSASVCGLVAPNTEAVFFRSSTRWIACRPNIPYFVHTDVVFHTFFHNTFRSRDFLQSDLRRIWEMERVFLENAAAVFFESDWGLQKARAAYGLTGDHYIVLRNGGVIEPPDVDQWDGETLRLVTMAKDFRQKGGDLVREAYRQLKPRYPNLSWHILGGPPDVPMNDLTDVHVEGFLRPDVPHELARMREILSDAFLLVHPTREDTNPLVLIEAAYFGCPAVSVNDFAIPELIVHGETGLLLPRPLSAAAIANAIEQLILDQKRYRQMRNQARERAVQQFNWDQTGEEMAFHIRRSLARRQQ
jgi:glycosyltransferase involved in cell wall biosynthesis